MVKRWEGLGVPYELDGEQLYLGPDVTFGLPIVISQSTYRKRVGPVSFLYGTTNALISDWRRVAAAYAGLFGLDPSRFSAIGSERFGYIERRSPCSIPQSARPHRVEPVTDNVHPMGRFARQASAIHSICTTSRCTTGRTCAGDCWRRMRATRRAAAIR